ncbi:DUF221 domain-containing protein [Purpureocillium lavendulum]|uniref:DUF221 domain-containing protein n=1 Tax=Purpureocillium lavendulum TaxID=1247861 RepID=A0AB34FZS8_9HYPO|nr:DUF221 domain-containing protein [Purpureocillium lavendulum]
MAAKTIDCRGSLKILVTRARGGLLRCRASCCREARLVTVTAASASEPSTRHSVPHRSASHRPPSHKYRARCDDGTAEEKPGRDSPPRRTHHLVGPPRQQPQLDKGLQAWERLPASRAPATTMGSFISWIKTNLPADDREGSANSPPQSAWVAKGALADAHNAAMVDTLVPVLVISAVYIIIFLIFRRSQRRFYAPRTYLGSLRENERSPELGGGWFSWFGTFWKLPDAHALTHQGLDAYLFLRYLRVACIITLVSIAVTWPILFPVNATGSNGQTQLEVLSYSNINPDTEGNRYFAHALVAWVVYGFVMYMIMRECIFYINLRQAYLLTPHYSKRISSRTVLFTSVPDEYLNEAKIREMFNNSVRHVWVAGSTKKIDELVEERDKVAMKLEGAEVKLLKLVNKARTKAAKKGGAAPAANNGHSQDATADAEAGSIAARWIPDSKRPSHRLGPLGLIGQKVDTIDWSRAELQRTIPEAEKIQNEWAAGNFDKVNAVFVEFMNQADAQAAYQVLTHHQALHMTPKVVGVKPEEVVWKNLSIPWWQLVIRRYAVYAFIAVLIIFWAIPVAIVGLIAQVNTLKQLPGLTWLDSIPKPILGVVSGLLPAVALSILMSFVPIIMRSCARLAGIPTLSRIELFTQNAYFVFQVVQVFLIRSLFDAASTALIEIVNDPSSVFTTLGQTIPTSANFYISYFMVQGLTIATGVVTQVVGLFVFRLLYKFLAGTPRAMYNKWTTLSGILWGSLLPVYTNIICISGFPCPSLRGYLITNDERTGLIYSVIAPFILFWSSIAMGLFYLAYRYNILFVSETSVDTQGLIYPRALKQLFTGVYLAEIVMVGMFAVTKAAGPAVLMAVFLVFSILYHITISRYLDPLLYGLPRSVQAREQAIRSGIVSPASPANAEEGLAGNKASNESSTPEKKAAVSEPEAPPKKGNVITRFLMPWIFYDYERLRSMMPAHDDMDFDSMYSDEVERTAYMSPSVTSKAPTLWIPRDPAGVSRQEVVLTGKVIPISDEGATLDEKNNIVWDTEGARPPIWDEKIYY